MDIKVGEYVRTKYGEFALIKEVYPKIKAVRGKNKNATILEFNLFKKHSFNIMDLIEVGDIVILEYYIRKYGKRISRKFEIEHMSNEVIYFDNRHCSFCYVLKENKWRDGKGYNPKIKTIVTKEQFKAMEYEV